jgi:hypothetical protein
MGGARRKYPEVPEGGAVRVFALEERWACRPGLLVPIDDGLAHFVPGPLESDPGGSAVLRDRVLHVLTGSWVRVLVIEDISNAVEEFRGAPEWRA